jgi:transcriptional regulator with GAF, ATPase, and Fis domain
MAELPEYLLEPLHEDEEFRLYRGHSKDGQAPSVLLLAPTSARRTEEATPGPTSTIATPLEHLDLASVIKVSQAVSGEIVLEKLINTLMRTAIKQAGAERGLLILPRKGDQRIAAEATTGGDAAQVELRDVPVAAAVLPESVLNYVLHTRESVILDDAAAHPQFATDPYLRQHRARSVLCLPLTNEAQLVGALYLENNLTTCAFTPIRIAALKLIASQAAISLENSRLYRDLEQREADLEKALAENKLLRDQLHKENLALRDEVDWISMFEEIVGTSRALQSVLSRVLKVSPTNSTVLITGETGTGKELIAHAIHKRSARSQRAFVGVNCAALAPSLISSELFGHEKGAFTGALQRRLGRFELANGGTIFLDDVGELPADTQVALLRVLQEREFERVGGTQTVQVDVRVIGASNRNLEAATANGTFRQDLFYRLNVFPIEVPPLRERKDDILMLVNYLVQRYARSARKQIRSVEKKTLELFQSYDWPGNIRELQNVVERSVILTSGDVLRVDESWLPRESPQRRNQVEVSNPFGSDRDEERKIIQAALVESRGRVYGSAGAAAKLGIPPSTLDYKIKTLEIRKSRLKYR